MNMRYVMVAWASKLLLGAVAGLALVAMPGLAFAEKKGTSARDDAPSGDERPAAKGKKGHAATKRTAKAPRGKREPKAKSTDKPAAGAKDKPAARARDKHESKPAAARHAKGKTAQVGHGHGRRTGEGADGKATDHDKASKSTCVREAVEIARASGESEHFALTRCNGKPAEHAVEKLSVLLRPYSVPKPAKLPDIKSARPRGKDLREGEVLPGIKLADAGLISRLQAVATQFPNKKISVVSGYRPGSTGSYHKHAKAIDLKVEGVKNEELVTFCRSLVDTGCGFYPNSSFVHLDVRPRGTGHVHWIDASGPGESPRYVRSWPPREGVATEEIDRPDHAAPADEQTHPDARKKAGKGGELDRDSEDDPGERSPTSDTTDRLFPRGTSAAPGGERGAPSLDCLPLLRFLLLFLSSNKNTRPPGRGALAASIRFKRRFRRRFRFAVEPGLAWGNFAASAGLAASARAFLSFRRSSLRRLRRFSLARFAGFCGLPMRRSIAQARQRSQGDGRESASGATAQQGRAEILGPCLLAGLVDAVGAEALVARHAGRAVGHAGDALLRHAVAAALVIAGVERGRIAVSTDADLHRALARLAVGALHAALRTRALAADLGDGRALLGLRVAEQVVLLVAGEARCGGIIGA
jgi:uncharacterized protein YcbK (DUF882 family)